MAKNHVTDWDPTASGNTDAGGVGIAGSSSIRLGNDAIQTVMSQIAKVNAGTDPVADTWTFGDPADLTKRARLDAGNVTAGQTRVLTMRNADLDLANVFTNVVQQVFTGSGTYTPTTGMKFCIIECIGGGGGGGGAQSSSGSGAGGGGGQAGGYSRSRKTASDIGTSQTVTIGAAGSAGSSGAGTGGTGGDTSVGSLVVARGGAGGVGSSGSTPGAGGSAGSTGTGDVTIAGTPGNTGYSCNIVTVAAFSGSGGSGPFGAGGRSVVRFGTGVVAGVAGNGYGAGGGGAVEFNASSGVAGGAGAAGLVIITEFIG